METKINFEDLMNLTIGQLLAKTKEFLKNNPEFKTAEELLKEEK